MAISAALASIIAGVGSAAASGIASGVSSGKLNRATRNFNHREAELARQWQEDFYNKYQSPSAMVQQYRDAGLNPALMYQNGAGSASAVSSSPANAGSVVSPDFSGFGDIGTNILQLAELMKNNKVQRDTERALQNKYNAEAELSRSQKTGQDIQNDFSPKLFEQNLKQGELNLENTKAGINLALSQLDLNKDVLLTNAYNRSYLAALTEKVGAERATELVRKGLITMQTLLASSEKQNLDLKNFQEQWRNSFIANTDVDPVLVNSVWNGVNQYMGGLYKYIKKPINNAVDSIKKGATSVYNFIKSDPLKQLYYKYFKPSN